ncbi:MAG TPA: Na+/H+ antiporter NhaA [Alphaproteobacteria bacterium]|nr:Na+/H+ antiporter NhaA [Alphaproteobacteria bacterium]
MFKYLRSLSPDVQGGLALALSAMAALLVVNLGGAEWYHHVLEYELPVELGPFGKSLHSWVNDGLMPLFFLLIGIEIHREFRHGELHGPGKLALPFATAAGGVLLPVLVFVALVWGNATLIKGAAIPMATDTAFALALLAALKGVVPPSIRAFLLALAVIDDLMAVAMIALFYTQQLQWMNVFLAAVVVGMLYLKNVRGFRDLRFFLASGFLMWLCVLQSGVHTSVAGVLAGVMLPLKGREGKTSAADRVEHALMPWVRWLVLPLFGFLNAGINFTDIDTQILSALVLAIAAALFFGKQAGIFGCIYLMEKLGWAKRPTGTSWRHIYGMSLLCGIGFTMSLFIGNLALPEHLQGEVRLGVIIGSMVSAVAACAVLAWGPRLKQHIKAR